jgi:uncharacterized damage-inducible protein DinB
MNDVLLQAFRYNRWANLHVLDICSTLDEQQLQLSSPGTYGTIAATLQHLFAAEQRYVRRLVGTQPRISEHDGFTGIAALKEHAERSGDDLIEAVGRVNPDDSTEVKNDSGEAGRVKQWVVMTQAIHHGNDHRTQICTILGQNGIECGEMDVWAFGEASGGYEAC